MSYRILHASIPAIHCHTYTKLHVDTYTALRTQNYHTTQPHTHTAMTWSAKRRVSCTFVPCPCALRLFVPVQLSLPCPCRVQHICPLPSCPCPRRVPAVSMSMSLYMSHFPASIYSRTRHPHTAANTHAPPQRRDASLPPPFERPRLDACKTSGYVGVCTAAMNALSGGCVRVFVLMVRVLYKRLYLYLYSCDCVFAVVLVFCTFIPPASTRLI